LIFPKYLSPKELGQEVRDKAKTSKKNAEEEIELSAQEKISVIIVDS
jgi:hypothetical protein